jgi:hypothetical protein
MVNIYKIANRQSRDANYEQILRILNDCLQGITVGLGFILGGTYDFLTNTNRGVYSYQALQSRLNINTFSSDKVTDFTGPVIMLSGLTLEDFYVLLQNVRHVYASGEPDNYLIPDVGIHAFMSHCATTIGDNYFRTPRTAITSFINLLAILAQNTDPTVNWKTFINSVKVVRDSGGDKDTDELESFRL